jgi:hypothetical protein
MDIALARSDIGQLAQRYAVAVDSKDIAMLASLFMAPEGSDRAAFRQEVVQRFTANLAKVRLSFMNVGTHLIEDVGDTSATGLVYCKAEFVVADEWLEQAVLYRDTYACRDGSWYFAERIHELWYGAPRGLNPLTLPPAEWPKRQIGMGTVPASWPSYQAFWNSTAPE